MAGKQEKNERKKYLEDVKNDPVFNPVKIYNEKYLDIFLWLLSLAGLS